MRPRLFVRRTRLPAAAEDAFRWHACPDALARLAPPWLPVTVLSRSGGLEDGARVVLGLRRGPVHWRWVAEHRDCLPGRQFCDVQVAGPFAFWEHTHRFEPAGPEACILEDRIRYRLPFGPGGQLLAGWLVERQLARLFAYRHAVTAQDLAAHAPCREGKPMHVLVSGASGLIGSALVPFLTTGGHRVTRLVRTTPPPEGAVAWNPDYGELEASALEGLDAVVHLAGENIARGRWTPEKKARIRDSRVHGTRLLCETLARLERPPQVLVSASAIGYYGNRGDELLREESPPGDDFLAQVCRDWEAATAPAAARGIRVVNLRLGVVLSPRGGALAQMLTPFRLGLGGVVGTGRQYISWIAIDDVVEIIHFCLLTESLKGPVNAVAPQPVTNAEFTRTLGRVLRRPTLLPLPAAVARLLFGEMADALLLASTRVEPARLLASGYRFRYPELEGALRHLLGKPRVA
ncbi:MAG: hypothetical protein KatS3mg131_3854 [Candidatus Tectimicrobiota bacterium]|nr:MAG: hypothetical protein KatS3mg131_3854 [Candidatus Tectomicrobia bacterium]